MLWWIEAVQLIRMSTLALILAVVSGCAPLAVGTTSAIWYGVQGKKACGNARNDPDFKEKLRNPDYRKHFEYWCGPIE
ncbi:MAG: hypothetical protein OXF11_07200 [Deltaproteobacteria bacterium]|nr:hypothetical protein [Deltaproteobacteria bacterium]